MVLSDVRCKICDKLIGYDHYCNHTTIITHHFKDKHPKEYAEMREAAAKLRQLKIKYGYGGFL